MRKLIYSILHSSAILAGPLAAFTFVSIGMLLNRAVVFHQPSGLYFFTLYPVVILSFIYWGIFLIFELVSKIKHSSDIGLVLNCYLFHLIGFVVFIVFWAEQMFAFFASTLVLSILFLFTHFKLKDRISFEEWKTKNNKMLWSIFFFVTFILPAVALIFVRVVLPEPRSPFEERNEIVSCSSEDDCKNFNCTGFNTGAWYCDTDGYPRCDFERSQCTCRVGCL